MTTADCPDTLTLTAYAAGAYDDLTRARIAQHLAACDSCRRRADALAAERSDFLAAHPFQRTIRLPERKVIPFPAYRVVYALAATLLVTAGIGTYYATMAPDRGVRIKGDVRVSLYVQESDGAVSSRADNVFHPGERIQFTCLSGANTRLMLLSIDDSGRVSTFFPHSGDTAMAMEPGRDAPLPNSIVLDDYIGRELYLVVLSEKKFLVSDITRRIGGAYSRTPDLERLDPDLGGGFTVRRVLITKTPGRP